MHRAVPYSPDAEVNYLAELRNIAELTARGAAIRQELQTASSSRDVYAQYNRAHNVLRNCKEFAAALVEAKPQFRRHIDEIEERITALAVASAECAGQLQAAEERASALHAFAQKYSMADLPADLYNMFFRFEHRGVCRRLLRWSQEQNKCMLYRPPGRASADVASARAFLLQYPNAILSVTSRPIDDSPGIRHTRMLVEDLHADSGLTLKHATHIVCTPATLSVLNHAGATKVEYVQMMPGAARLSGTIRNARPIRMTQSSYELCVAAGYTFAGGIELVPVCEIGYVRPQRNITRDFAEWVRQNTTPADPPESTTTYLRGRHGRGN